MPRTSSSSATQPRSWPGTSTQSRGCTPSLRSSCSQAPRSPVSDARQTEEFFAASWEQYDGVDAMDRHVVVMAEAPSSIWVDVTWSYGGMAKERFCYQLVDGLDGYQIAVLTFMEPSRDGGETR